MAWTEITRAKYRRDGLRYASDTTGEEWAVIEPHLPPPAGYGRKRHTWLRDVCHVAEFDRAADPGIAMGSSCQELRTVSETPESHCGPCR
jgi:transposase